METKPYSLQAPEQIAKEYGGNKRAIAQAAQQGLLDPTAAILAGMFIDRMRNAAAMEQAPTQTVAQDVMAPPQMGMPSQPPMGLADVPIPENMYEPSYGGGGIVAFEDGGHIQKFQFGGQAMGFPAGTEPFVETSYTTPEEIRAYQPRFFPNMGGGNRRFRLMQLGYTRDQIEKMPVDQQEFIVQRAGATSRPTPAALDADQMPADVASGAFVDKALADRGIAYETQSPAASVAPPAPPAAAKAPGMNMRDIMSQADIFAKAAVGEAPKIKTMDEAGKTLEDALTASGFDPRLLERQQQQLETEKQSLAKDRKTAMDMRIIEAGLGIMAGTSPHAFVNIGKGATPAVQGLAKDIKELKAAERDFTKAQMDLDTKKNDFALGKAKIKMSDIEKSQERVDKYNDDVVRARTNIGNTLLEGKLREQLVAKTGAAGTDFSRKWQLYVESLKPGEKPTPEGFMRVWGRPDSATEIQQINAALKAQELGLSPEELRSMQARLFGGGPQFQEGQRSKDTTGKPIVFRNGQWVYE